MSVNIPFSLVDLQQEFHPNVRPTSMKPMAERIFGSAPNIRLTDFDGFGSPFAVILTPDNISSNDARLRVDIQDWGGVTVSFWFEFWELKSDGTNLNQPDSGDTVHTTTTNTADTNGIHTVMASSSGFAPDDNTDYAVRVFYENEFNVNNPIIDSGEQFTTEQDTSDIPSLVGSPDSFLKSSAEVHLEWNVNATPSDFTMRFRINGGTWQTNSNSFTNQINWGTSSNPKEGDIFLPQFLDPGDTIDIQLKSNTNSTWSNTITLTN